MNRGWSRFLSLLTAALLPIACDAESVAALSSADGVHADIAGRHAILALTDADEPVLESEELRLYYREADGVLSVEDRRSGYVFASGRADAATEKLSAKWQAFAASLCVGDFVTPGNLNTFQESPARTVMRRDGGELVFIMSFEKAGYDVRMHMWLEGDSLCVSIPDGGIASASGVAALLKLSVLPFLGAGFRGEGEGYVFMPDGSGALMRFDSPSGTRALTLRAYGADGYLTALGESMSLIAELPVKKPEHAALPVMGIVHGADQAAFCVWPESGDAYCDMMASPAGNNNLPCSYACFQAIYRQIYQQPMSEAEFITLAQTSPNTVDLRLRYTFLTGESASYAGMARAYRESLLARGELSRLSDAGDMPVMIDCLMSESVKVLAGTRVQVMTSADDIAEWLQTLAQSGVRGVRVVIEGASAGGASRHRYDDFGINDALGDIGALFNAAGDVDVLIGRNLLRFFGDQLPASRRAYAVTRRFIKTDETFYLDDAMYALRLDRLTDLAERFTRAARGKGVASDDIGQYLYANEMPSACDRAAAVDIVRRALAILSQDNELALAQPSAYALAFADMAYDLPVSNSSFEFETDAVPFLQMVYSGCLPAFDRSRVAGAQSAQSLLRLVDFNLYPHYTLTRESASALTKSNSSGLFATKAEDLLPDLAEEYAYLSRYLKPVYGQMMTDRECPADGVSVTTYENGARIAVNYTDADYDYQGWTVAAQSARLIEKEEAP